MQRGRGSEKRLQRCRWGRGAVSAPRSSQRDDTTDTPDTAVLVVLRSRQAERGGSARGGVGAPSAKRRTRQERGAKSLTGQRCVRAEAGSLARLPRAPACASTPGDTHPLPVDAADDEQAQNRVVACDRRPGNQGAGPSVPGRGRLEVPRRRLATSAAVPGAVQPPGAAAQRRGGHAPSRRGRALFRRLPTWTRRLGGARNPCVCSYTRTRLRV